MILYVNINADSPERGLVSSAEAPAHIDAPSFVAGDNERLYVYLVDGKGAFSDVASEPGIGIKIAIGTIGSVYSLNSTFSQIPPFGWTGLLNLSTVELLAAVGTQDFINAILEIEITRADGTVDTIVHQRCEIRNQLITGIPTTPNPSEQYFTQADALSRFVQNRSALTGTIGGGAAKLDGVPTVAASFGWLAAVTWDGIVRFYQLISSTTAENAPWFIRPDDYDSLTPKVWKLVATDIAGYTHDQIAPANLWTGTHGFGYRPSGVAIYVNGKLSQADVDITDQTYTVNFGANFSGQLRLR